MQSYPGAANSLDHDPTTAVSLVRDPRSRLGAEQNQHNQPSSECYREESDCIRDQAVGEVNNGAAGRMLLSTGIGAVNSVPAQHSSWGQQLVLSPLITTVNGSSCTNTEHDRNSMNCQQIDASESREYSHPSPFLITVPLRCENDMTISTTSSTSSASRGDLNFIHYPLRSAYSGSSAGAVLAAATMATMAPLTGEVSSPSTAYFFPPATSTILLSHQNSQNDPRMMGNSVPTSSDQGGREYQQIYNGLLALRTNEARRQEQNHPKIAPALFNGFKRSELMNANLTNYFAPTSTITASNVATDTVAHSTRKKRSGRSSAASSIRKSFNERLRNLLEYKKTNGHCNVPRQYPLDPSLGAWCNNIRYSFRQIRQGQRPHNSISSEDIRTLTAVGFKWHLKRRHRKKKS